MPLDILLGLQWGDEGKGKIIDVIAPEYDIVARYQGGPNAGHTVYYQEKKYVLHQIPSGIFHSNVVCVVGNGVVLNPYLLLQEMQELIKNGWILHEKLIFSSSAHLILPTHILIDSLEEKIRGRDAIGSTKRGIGPAYQDKVARKGIRLGDVFYPNFEKIFISACNAHNEILAKAGMPVAPPELINAYLEAIYQLKEYPIIDTSAYLTQALKQGKSILAEGAQGFGLDIDHGSYPYVTSSSTCAAGACLGLGVPPKIVRKVIGISKAYATRVGNGPFPTEQNNAIGDKLREKGKEYGATTGRPRRCGWLDLVVLQKAIDINGVTEIVLTKLDVLCNIENIFIATEYLTENKNLPYPYSNIEPVYQKFKSWETTELSDPRLKYFLDEIQKKLNTPISYISIGPKREQMLLVQ
jgi:adenylosuccinate synthase